MKSVTVLSALMRSHELSKGFVLRWAGSAAACCAGAGSIEKLKARVKKPVVWSTRRRFIGREAFMIKTPSRRAAQRAQFDYGFRTGTDWN